MSRRLTLILGGARSGKSAYALQLADQLSQIGAPKNYRVLFVATALAFDDEMTIRIQRHKNERPANWFTLETPTQVGRAIRACPVQARVLVLDCLTLLANNVLLEQPEPDTIPEEIAQGLLDSEVDDLLEAYQASSAEWIIISNEVGLGIVPPTPLGRIYRDVLGRANQRLAQIADRVVLMVAGIPIPVK